MRNWVPERYTDKNAVFASHLWQEETYGVYQFRGESIDVNGENRDSSS